jgi:hypothetical protein
MSSPTPSERPDTLLLSSLEFSRMLLDSDMPDRAANTFRSNPTLIIALRHYHHVSITIQMLELELERQHIEQHQMFGHLMNMRPFRDDIEPLVANYREQARHQSGRARYSPYARTPPPIDTPSDGRSEDPPSTAPPSPIEILPIPAPERSPLSNLSSYATAIDEEPGSSPRNPIDVDQILDTTTNAPIRDTPIPSRGILERNDQGPTPVLRCFHCRSTTIHINKECIRRGPRSDDSLARGMGRNRRRPRTPQ